MVDDLETNRFLLEEALAETGVEILSADGGRRALEIVSASHPEVVVVDFQMPGLNGAATARRIKQLERSGAPFSYVILMSGYPGDGMLVLNYAGISFKNRSYLQACLNE